MGKAAWRLRTITHQSGTETVIETRAESDLRPGAMYKWRTYVTQENDGRITTGNTTLTSVWEEKNHLEKAIQISERRLLDTMGSVSPEEFEQECEEIAGRCGDETQRIEREVIADLEKEEEDASRREKSRELMARLLTEGRNKDPGQDGGAPDGRESER